MVPLGIGETFTGEWADVSTYPSLVLAVATDQDGTAQIQYSPDGANVDSALTRYHRVGLINPPFRFTNTRKYARVTFANTSGIAQSYLRIQVVLGDRTDLNAPLDSTLAQNFDAIATRPTDYAGEVALGKRQGSTLWNKFGFNLDVDSGAAEVVASWGGTFTPMTTARTLSIVSDDANDTSGGTGANSVVVYGIDADRRSQVEVVTLNGTTPVVTATTWLGVNRISIALAGSGQANAGTITATATTDATIQGQVPAGLGSSQQCIFHTQEGHQALAEWITVDVVRFAGGTQPVVTLKGWVFSAVSNSKYEVVRVYIDSSISNSITIAPPSPFPIGESSTFWLEATTSENNTEVAARITLKEIRNSDT